MLVSFCQKQCFSPSATFMFYEENAAVTWLFTCSNYRLFENAQPVMNSFDLYACQQHFL
jgi:hypothetical protein